MINAKEYKNLLKEFDIGSSVAESDTALREARVETPVFGGLARDEIDLVRGTKGSGKTALFLIFSDHVKDYLLSESNIAVVNGVEPQGDPVFQSFNDKFGKLNEIELQNFWRIYFVSLIDRYFIEDPRFDHIKSTCAPEVQEFKSRCKKSRIPQMQQRS